MPYNANYLTRAATDVLVATGGEIQPDCLYSSDQTSAMLDISKRTLARWRQDGCGPVVTRLYPNAPPKYRGADLLNALKDSREPSFSHK